MNLGQEQVKQFSFQQIERVSLLVLRRQPWLRIAGAQKNGYTGLSCLSMPQLQLFRSISRGKNTELTAKRAEFRWSRVCHGSSWSATPKRFEIPLTPVPPPKAIQPALPSPHTFARPVSSPVCHSCRGLAHLPLGMASQPLLDPT